MGATLTIPPITIFEYIFTLVMIVFCLITTAYIISIVSTILNDISAEKK